MGGVSDHELTVWPEGFELRLRAYSSCSNLAPGALPTEGKHQHVRRPYRDVRRGVSVLATPRRKVHVPQEGTLGEAGTRPSRHPAQRAGHLCLLPCGLRPGRGRQAIWSTGNKGPAPDPLIHGQVDHRQIDRWQIDR